MAKEIGKGNGEGLGRTNGILAHLFMKNNGN